jgi:hypothetical protein
MSENALVDSKAKNDYFREYGDLEFLERQFNTDANFKRRFLEYEKLSKKVYSSKST